MRAEFVRRLIHYAAERKNIREGHHSGFGDAWRMRNVGGNGDEQSKLSRGSCDQVANLPE